MRLSTSTNIYFNRPQGRKVSMVESVRACAAAGYTVMDLNFHDAATFIPQFRSPRTWRSWLEPIAQAAVETGVTFSQAHLPIHNVCDRSSPEADERDRWVRQAIDGCALIGIPWAVAHVGTVYGVSRPRAASMSQNAEYFRDLLEYAGARGVGVAFENLWDYNIAPQVRFGTTAEEIAEFVDTLDLPNAGICWDFEHAALMQQSQAAGLALVGPRLKATHVSDYVNIEADHLLPFHGKLDWREAMGALAAVDYTGDLTFEIHNYLCGVPDELIHDGLRRSVSVGGLLLDYAQQQAPR